MGRTGFLSIAESATTESAQAGESSDFLLLQGSHSFASWAFEGGRSIVWVQHRLGHSSPKPTLPYAVTSFRARVLNSIS